MITALAAGNAVILKCSERAPETAALIAELCARVNFPQNLVQVMHGGPEEAEALLDASPDFVFFTGSSHHGQLVAQRAARHLIPAVLELGGKDASLVFEDCHLDRAVEGIAYGAFSNAGRVCVAVKRVYVHESIFEEFRCKVEGPDRDAPRWATNPIRTCARCPQLLFPCILSSGRRCAFSRRYAVFSG